MGGWGVRFDAFNSRKIIILTIIDMSDNYGWDQHFQASAVCLSNPKWIRNQIVWCARTKRRLVKMPVGLSPSGYCAAAEADYLTVAASQ